MHIVHRLASRPRAKKTQKREMFTPEGQSEPIGVPALPVSALNTEHRLVDRGSGVVCMRCGCFKLCRPKRAFNAFLGEPCVDKQGAALSRQLWRPVPLHEVDAENDLAKKLHVSHKLYLYRGLWYCAVCGAVAARKPQGLAEACRGFPGKSGKRALRLLCKGVAPYAAAFPDDRSELPAPPARIVTCDWCGLSVAHPQAFRTCCVCGNSGHRECLIAHLSELGVCPENEAVASPQQAGSQEDGQS